jgi:glycerol kinase
MTPRPFFLVLDQGSHASRATVFDAGGGIVASAERALGTRRPRPGWVEHDAEEVMTSLREAIVAAVAGIRGAPIASAGLAIQRSSVVCWDRDSGVALSPVLSWQDRRNAAWLAAQEFDAGWLREITGLVASPHYGASKLRWCLDHLPEVQRALLERRLCCGPLASYVLHRLLAERPCLVDPANASRTLLWDIRTQDWSAELLQSCGIWPDLLPRCVPSRHAFGTLGVDGREVPLSVMTGDQPAALFAWGEPDADTLFVNIGTGAFVQRVFEGTAPHAPGLLASVAWQDKGRSLRVLEGTVNGAGAALDWLASERGVSLESLHDGARRWLAKIEDPPLFINGVGGLGAPWWVADCPIRFSRVASLAEEVTGLLESIVFLLQVNIDALRASSDAHVGAARRIVVTGGIARLDAVCRRLADLSGLEVERPADIEATARGLAWLLSGVSAPDHAQATHFTPRQDHALAARFARWRELLDASLAGLVTAVPRG